MVTLMSVWDRKSKAGRTPIDDLRGATRLAVEATRAVTDLVEAMHLNGLKSPPRKGVGVRASLPAVEYSVVHPSAHARRAARWRRISGR